MSLHLLNRLSADEVFAAVERDCCELCPSLPADTSDMSFEELLELQSRGGPRACKQLAGRSAPKQSPRQPVCVADKHR